MMKKNALAVMMLAILLLSCMPAEKPQLANPASVHCAQSGGKVDIRTNADGSQTGYCILKDGKECEEWAYYRQQCPG